MPDIQLSVILITQNEAQHIRACLASVAFADEWIVVDSGSTDGTGDIAASLGAKVETTSDWPGFGLQKNRALARASGRWVLTIDADEVVSDTLAASIRAVVADTTSATAGNGGRPVAYELSRISRFCGQWMRHGDWYPDRVVRLFQRGTARFSDDRVHERVIVDERADGNVGTPVGRLEGDLLHDTMPSLEDAIDKMNRYTTGRARDLLQRGRRGGLASALGHGVWAFVRCYAVKRGFLDGRMGVVLAIYVAQSTYYRYLKMGLAARDAATAQ